jgi:hypothetical protein
VNFSICFDSSINQCGGAAEGGGVALPAKDLAHAVVAGFLGLEQLANLDGDRTAALAQFDRASALALLADMAGAMPWDTMPGDESGDPR